MLWAGVSSSGIQAKLLGYSMKNSKVCEKLHTAEIAKMQNIKSVISIQISDFDSNAAPPPLSLTHPICCLYLFSFYHLTSGKPCESIVLIKSDFRLRERCALLWCLFSSCLFNLVNID